MAWAEEQACRGSGRVSEPKQAEGGVREKGLPAVGGDEAAPPRVEVAAAARAEWRHAEEFIQKDNSKERCWAGMAERGVNSWL